jgi:thioredoxin-related protein
MRKLKLLIIISTLLLGFSAKAQKDKFSGTWFLQQRTIISGPDYINGVPKQISIKILADSISIGTISENEKGDYTITELTSLDGKPVTMMRPGNIKRSSTSQWIEDRKSLKKVISYYKKDNDTEVEYTTTEVWKLSADGDTLTLLRTQNKGDSTKGEYVKTNHGIKFETALSWEQIKQKAKKENKYVFVDCYATWCGPCKTMDRDVYPKNNVGEFMNDRFISVKVQLDTSKADDEQTKRWYQDAAAISKDYKIIAFPTYLFFAPDGQIVHRGVGAKKVAAFIALVTAAIDPKKQYYTLLKKIKNTSLNQEELFHLYMIARDLGDIDIALDKAKRYMHEYLDKLNDKDLISKQNLLFFDENITMLKSNDRIFKLYQQQSKKIDSILELNGYSKAKIDYIITKEEITPWVTIAKRSKSSPNWPRITTTMRKKFNRLYVDRNIAASQVVWYKYKKDWAAYTKYLVKKMGFVEIEKLPSDIGSIMLLNSAAWDVFLYSFNKEELETALKWSSLSVSMNSTISIACMDTKANLLYKLGRKKEAIALETKAIQMEPKFEEGKAHLSKMKLGQSTWLVQ